MFVFLCVFPVVAAQDIITCGDCQQEFALSDILHYVQHKVNRCNKENEEPFETRSEEYEEPDGDQQAISSAVISNRRTSISAPIARKGSPDPHSSRPQLPPGPRSPSRQVSLVSTSQQPGDLPDDQPDSGQEDACTGEDASSSGCRATDSPIKPSTTGGDQVEKREEKFCDAEANTTSAGNYSIAVLISFVGVTKLKSD